MSEDVNGFLKHYGVIGMKWGVRKDDPGGPGYSKSQTGTFNKSELKVF